MNPHDPTHAGRAAGIIAAAKSVGVDAFTVSAATVDQLDGAFAEIARSKTDALIILGTPIFNLIANDITKLSLARKLPVFSDSASAVRLGIGVMGYGADVKDLFLRAAYYVDRILKGAKPSDLPVEQPTKFELVVNLKTAKAIGLTIPQALLARADEVIE
jgi:putative ABC transport system substrate-binding protein